MHENNHLVVSLMMRMLQRLNRSNQKDSSKTLDIENDANHLMYLTSMMTTTTSRTTTTWSTTVLQGFQLATLKPVGQYV
jgi:hypothetical protein